jgi:hypothetical protein
MHTMIITYRRPRGNEEHTPALSIYTLAPQEQPDQKWKGNFNQATERLVAATGVDTITAQLALVEAWTQGTTRVTASQTSH